MRKTEIVPYNKNWLTMFAEDSLRIKEVFQNKVIDIIHVGSTSVPNIGFAKPIIDILVIVQDINMVDNYNDKMKVNGTLLKARME